MSRKTKNISRFVNIGVGFPRTTKASRSLTQGIARYAAGKPNWRLRLIDVYTARRYHATISSLSNRWDGLIGNSLVIRHHCETAPSPIPYIVHTPLQNIATTSIPFCGAIACDDFAIGRAGANFFLHNNLRHVAYVGFPFDSEQKHSAMRFEAFHAAAKEAGVTCANFQITFKNENKILPRLTDWLRGLPIPCGVLAYSDSVAQLVLEACTDAGLHVPAQIQVIGVDNDEDICETVRPTLTSILPDFEGGGYRAAQILDAVLSGRRFSVKPEVYRYGVKNIIVRSSTQNASSRTVSHAQAFIRSHAQEFITTLSIAEHLNVSRRTLERRFREVLGESVAEVLRKERLMHVRRLLEKTNRSLADIAYASGFSSATHLQSLFKKTYGLTMGAYRAQAQH